MSWTYEFDARALREFARLDRQARRRIARYLDTRIATAEDPRRFGKGLKSNLAGLWRYPVGDHRIVCRIEDKRLIVLVIKVAHRRAVYD